MSEPTPALLLEITVVVHPVNTDLHDLPPGWRWAVMVGGRPPADLDHCVQAGHDPEKPAALVAGESHGVACVQAFRRLGSPARYAVLQLDWDPLPPDAGQHPIAVFE